MVKRIYVIHCIITDTITNTISDTSLIAVEDAVIAKNFITAFEESLKDSILSLVTTLVSNNCNIPSIFQNADSRSAIKKENITFNTSSVVLSNRRVIRNE